MNKGMGPGGFTSNTHCIDCGLEGRAMMCSDCAHRLAEDVINASLDKDEKPTLKVFEITVDPVETHHLMGDWHFVMVLSKDEESAVDFALAHLAFTRQNLILQNLKWKVVERKGPFADGYILSAKTMPAL